MLNPDQNGQNPAGKATISGDEPNTFRDWYNSAKPLDINLSAKVSDPPRRFKAQLGERANMNEEPLIGEKVGSGSLQSEEEGGEDIKMRCIRSIKQKFEMGGFEECVLKVQCAVEEE